MFRHLAFSIRDPELLNMEGIHILSRREALIMLEYINAYSQYQGR